jgi:alpha-tubulin suppressor-like RCC1 family protein
VDANGIVWTSGNTGIGSSSQPAKFQNFADAISVSMGQSTIWVILADNSLWGAGSNSDGQMGLGNSSLDYQSQPTKVLDNVKQIVQIGTSSYAVLMDGTLWAWGNNAYGQLGLGDQNNRNAPVQVVSLSNVVQVASSGNHTVALTSDGNVWAMGTTNTGELCFSNGGLIPGDPGFYQTTPIQVTGIDQVATVAAASNQTFLIRKNGSLWVCGQNGNGSLGLGAASFNVTTPTQVAGLNGVTAVASNGIFYIALLSDGSVWGVGANLNGQLGGVGDGNQPTPVLLPFVSAVAAIAVSELSGAGFAMRNDGTIVTWGDNTNESLGRGAIALVLPPGPMSGPAGAGIFNVFAAEPSTINQPPSLSVAVTSSGTQAPVNLTATVSATDSDGYVVSLGLLSTDGRSALISGTAGTTTFQFTIAGTYRIDAIAVDNLGAATVVRGQYFTVKPPSNAIVANAKVRGGPTSTIALSDTGALLSWQLNGLVGDTSFPTYVPPNRPPDFFTIPYNPNVGSVTNIETVSGGNFVVLQSGEVLAWGFNTSGQLGLGSIGDTGTPTLVPGLSGIAQVSGNNLQHSLALDTNGRVYATGINAYGQLGLGDQTTRSTFTLLPTPTNVVQVATGQSSASYALDSNGTVWAWGHNASGELASGNTSDSSSPKAIAGLPPISAVFGAPSGAFAIARDGSVWGWGSVSLPDNATGQPQLTPQLQPSLSGAIKIAAYFSYAIVKSDGTVWTWGDSLLLGDGTTSFRSTPSRVPNLTNVIDISINTNFAIALRADGTVVAWGDNFQGQLGDGTLALRLTPVAVLNETGDGLLDLVPEAAKSPDPGIFPPYFSVAAPYGSIAASTVTVNNTINFNAGDAGSSGSVFVTAKVPPGTLGVTQGVNQSAASTIAAVGTPPSKLSMLRPNLFAPPLPSTIRLPASKTTATTTPPDPSTYVLVQLTPTGWEQVVNGQLIPFASGVLGSQLSAQTILNNIDTTPLAGAQFCVGYGTSAAAMAAAGTVRTVVTIPSNPPISLSCAATVSPQTGYWYNPAESGRGYFLEYNGTKIFMATFLYDPSGRSTWYGAGPATMTGASFSTPMTAYSGGQTLTGSYVGPTQGNSPGNLVIDFSDASDGVMSWPGGQVPITRFSFVPNGLSSPPSATQPQTGWWFNPAESGRGYSIEIQNNTAFIAAYMYDTSGNPVWYDSGPAALTATDTYQGQWISNTGGQTLMGTYHPPTGTTNAGNLTIQFSSPTAGMLTLPNGNQIPIQRFGF